MTSVQRAILPYLWHIPLPRTKTCTCPADSFAPCGGQYEGRYANTCPVHGRGRGHARDRAGRHQPSCCPGPRPTDHPLLCACRACDTTFGQF